MEMLKIAAILLLPLAYVHAMDDPYSLATAVAPPPPPTSCIPDSCSFIQYINHPWSSGNGLVIQPRCVLNLGNKVIPPGKLFLYIHFFGYDAGSVTNIVQWTFEKKFTNFFTNKDPVYPTGMMEFQFQVFYHGAVHYWPNYVYTPPPFGACYVYIAP